MAEVKGKGIAAPVASTLAMANRFSRYKPEEGKAVRKIEVVEDRRLMAMKDAWKASYASARVVLLSDVYNAAIVLAHEMECTARELEAFSLVMPGFERAEDFHRAGVFISAMINGGKDSDYIIHSSHLPHFIGNLGYRNTKNITVKGDAGDYCGSHMEGGSLMVERNAGGGCGYFMEGGTITVEGNADDACGYGTKGGLIKVKGSVGVWCGDQMKGGTIIVEGDAGGGCGFKMEGGEIHVNGIIRSFRCDTKHGKIFNQGKLLYPQPTRLERFLELAKGLFRRGGHSGT